jgi:hypothetical protein
LESIGVDVLDIDTMLFTYFIRSSAKTWELIAPQGPFVRKEWVAKSSLRLEPRWHIIRDATRKQAKASLV